MNISRQQIERWKAERATLVKQRCAITVNGLPTNRTIYFYKDGRIMCYVKGDLRNITMTDDGALGVGCHVVNCRSGFNHLGAHIV